MSSTLPAAIAVGARGSSVECLGQTALSEEEEEVRRKPDVYLRIYRPVTSSDAPEVAQSLLEAILARQRADITKYHDFYPLDEIVGIHPFSGGFLLHLRNGQVHQYAKQRGSVAKTILPIRDCVKRVCVTPKLRHLAVLAVRQGQGHPQFVVHRCSLPYVESKADDSSDPGAAPEGRGLDWTSLDDVKAVKALNKIQEKQQELLGQLRIVAELGAADAADAAGLFQAKAAVQGQAGLLGSSGAELVVEVTNNSQFSFVGKYWRLGLSFRTQDRSDRTYHDSSPLPSCLAPDNSFEARFDLPSEVCAMQSFPIDVHADVLFNCQYNDHNVIQQRDVLTFRIDVLDFLSVRTSQQQRRRRDVGSVTAAATMTSMLSETDEDSFEDHLAKLTQQKKQAGPRMSRSICLECSPDLFRHFNHKPFFRQMADVLNLDGAETGVGEVTYSVLASLFGSLVGMTVTKEVSTFRVAFSHPKKDVLIALKRHFVELKLDFLSSLGEVEVELPRSVIDRAQDLKDKVDRLEAVAAEAEHNDSADNLARLRECYQSVRDISGKLP